MPHHYQPDLGAGGSSSTMMKLFTDEAQGLRVDP